MQHCCPVQRETCPCQYCGILRQHWQVLQSPCLDSWEVLDISNIALNSPDYLSQELLLPSPKGGVFRQQWRMLLHSSMIDSSQASAGLLRSVRVEHFPLSHGCALEEVCREGLVSMLAD